MLVLSRKIGERIIVGSEIEITVMDVHGKRVRLGIAAPREIAIQRVAGVPREEPGFSARDPVQVADAMAFSSRHAVASMNPQ